MTDASESETVGESRVENEIVSFGNPLRNWISLTKVFIGFCTGANNDRGNLPHRDY